MIGLLGGARNEQRGYPKSFMTCMAMALYAVRSGSVVGLPVKVVSVDHIIPVHCSAGAALLFSMSSYNKPYFSLLLYQIESPHIWAAISPFLLDRMQKQFPAVNIRCVTLAGHQGQLHTGMAFVRRFLH